MQSVTTVSAFEELVKQNKHVFVDFYADWCGPCRMIAPIIENLSKVNTHIVFVKINVDEGQELARKYGVSAMPTFLGFTDGARIVEVIGADKTRIEQVICAMK